MHDIIGQPLDALSSAVDAVLRSTEVLDEIEVKSIFEETSFLLLRAEEAISARHAEAFEALMKIYTEGLSHSEASFEEGIKIMSLHEPLLHTIHSLFVVVVKRNAFSIHSSATVELLQVISSLCDGAAIKERCGSLFMDDLIDLLERVYRDATEAKKNFHVQRAAMTALINLVKGSKQNKPVDLPGSLPRGSPPSPLMCFFLLQCIELLYRVSRQNNNVLSEIEDSHLSESLRVFPNDTTLLNRMTNLIKDISANRDEIRRYSLTHVQAADTTLTGTTDVYFTPFYLIILFTSTNADNITIPYRMIRSVTLGKDGRVVLKLEEFPVKLEALLNHTAGMDVVSLHMPVSQLNDFKKSCIRSWIVDALQSRKEEQRLSGHKRPLPAGESTGKLSVASDPIKETGSTEITPVPVKLSKGEPGSLVNGAKPLLDRVESLLQSGSHAPLLKLKRLIDVKTEYRRGEIVNTLNNIMNDVQGKVDSARATTCGVREEYIGQWTQRVDALEQHILETQELTARGVGTLNEGLRSIRSGDQALQERIACLEIEFQQTLEETRDLERTSVDQLMKKFSREIQGREYDLDQQLLQSNCNPPLAEYFR